ncbi:hypothetical protein [Atopobacter phocae]|uniref:hypothetical protein n=1 Tax=Atopobacter phocae TaxID=136492 RepID=UPI00046E68BB|nr:hypothetical protein [Atopobacter phocae]
MTTKITKNVLLALSAASASMILFNSDQILASEAVEENTVNLGLQSDLFNISIEDLSEDILSGLTEEELLALQEVPEDETEGEKGLPETEKLEELDLNNIDLEKISPDQLTKEQREILGLEEPNSNASEEERKESSETEKIVS